jgi:hypothetical protein
VTRSVDVHPRPAAPPITELPTRLRAQSEEWRLNEKRVAPVRMRAAFAQMVVTTLQPPWVTEEAVTARSPPNLLEDNPASG